MTVNKIFNFLVSNKLNRLQVTQGCSAWSVATHCPRGQKDRAELDPEHSVGTQQPFSLLLLSLINRFFLKEQKMVLYYL